MSAAPAAAIAGDSVVLDGFGDPLMPAPPISFAGPMSTASQTIFESLGADKIAELVNQTLTGRTIEGYDPTKGAGPMDFALARALMVISNGSAAEKAQLALFRSAAAKLARGEQPGADESKALRLFGIGYVQEGGESYLGGMTLGMDVGKGGAKTYSTLTEQLLADDFTQALSAISELEGLKQSSPAAFSATAAVLRKNEEILVLQNKAGSELKTAGELALKAKTEVAQVAVLQQQSAAAGQGLAAKRQETTAKGQALSEAVVAGAIAPTAPVPDLPAAGSEIPSRVDAGLAAFTRPDLMQALSVAGVAPEVVSAIVAQVADQEPISPPVAALVLDVVQSHAQAQALENRKSALDREIAQHQLSIDKLLGQARQAELKAQSTLAKARLATLERQELELQAQAAYAGANPADVARLKAISAKSSYTIDGIGRGLQQVAREVRTLIEQAAQQAAWQRGAGDPRRAVTKPAAPIAAQPARRAQLTGPVGAAISALPLGAARQSPAPAQGPAEALQLTQRKQELSRRLEARQIDALNDRRRQEADRQAARREALDWQAYREAHRAG